MTTQTFGTGVFGSNTAMFDGQTISPIDITYITCTYTPVTERASYSQTITPIGSYVQLAITGSNRPDLARGDNAYTPIISKDASHVPTYSKVGTP